MKSPFHPLLAGAICMVSLHAPLANAQYPSQQPASDNSGASLLTPDQLQNFVGRIALYPDDLVALVLPASTTPLDIVKAQRFLTIKANDPSAKPDPSIAPPVTGLLNYPDVVTLMGNDLDWTVSLGQAVTHQQADVLAAIQTFRRRAQTAGNLNTDDKQTVVTEDDTVKIVPSQPEKIYVPVYQPSTVIISQPSPAVAYSPVAYPTYYHPAAAATAYAAAGAATAYGVAWAHNSLYTAPYGANAAYYQNQRMNYANNSREDWQNYGKNSREDWQNYSAGQQTQRQNAVSGNEAARQSSLEDTTAANQGRRQDAAASAQGQRTANETQRQNAFSSAQSSRQANMPEGAGRWQSSGERSGGGSADRFGGGESSFSRSGGYGRSTEGSRGESFSQRGGRSFSSMGGRGGGRRR